MFSRQRPGPEDATTSSTPAGAGRHVSPPLIIAPVPRRATNGSILSSDSEQECHSRHPLPNTPLQSSTPSALNQQLPLNAIPDARNRPSSGGQLDTPHFGHNRTSSGGSAKSNLSASSRKSARFSPNLTANSPGRIHNPPPPGATPMRSALRTTPSPDSNFPPYRFPPQSPNVDSMPGVRIFHHSPPSFASHQPSNEQAGAGRNGLDGSDEDSTPGQRAFRSRPSPKNNRSPSVHRRSPSDRFDDSGYFSPQPSRLAGDHGRTSTGQPQGVSNATSPRNQAGGTTANENQQTASSRSTGRQQSSGPRVQTSWQAVCSPYRCSPVIPDLPQCSSGVLQNAINFTSTQEPVRTPCARHTPATPTHRRTHRDLGHIDTSFDHAGGQFNARPRSSQARAPQQTPCGPTRTVPTPSRDGAGVNSVVEELLRVAPSSVAWQTPRGVLTWTPHPGLPDSGANLLGGRSGGGGGSGGLGSSDWWTGGHPMAGACPGWTPGAWPPTPAAAATSRRAPIQLAPWLIPNPSNALLPHIMWDISQSPTTAKRITGNHVIRDLTDKLDDIATEPAVERLVVACQVGVAQQQWGHVEVRASRPDGVSVWDVFNGVYEYFQKRVSRRELDRMKDLLGDEELEVKMADAFYQRILVTPALPGYELKKGLRRVDCLADACFFWGLYVSYNDDNSWQLNLGLVNRRRGRVGS